jgi:uncharacterized membrane protein
MRRILSLLKNELVTGLLLLTPVVGTGYLVYWLITSVDGLFPFAWRPSVAGRPLPGLGLVAVLALAFVVGLFAHNFVGRKVIQLADGVVQKVPLFGGTYGLIKQVLEAVFSTGGGSFKRAVLVEYPLRGSWAIGFVTQSHASDAITNAAGAEVISVFVPTCPNPTSGFYLLVDAEHVRPLDMPVEQAFKLVLTMGIADADPSALATTGKWDRKTIAKGVSPRN